YEPCEGSDDRYTLKNGSTVGGLILHSDGNATTNHSTDFIREYDALHFTSKGKKTRYTEYFNAYDLVRIHKFGHLDAEVKDKTPYAYYPSEKAMKRLIEKDKRYKAALLNINSEGFEDMDFDEILEKDWRVDLKVEDGQYTFDADNFTMILTKGEMENVLGYNKMTKRVVITSMPPWVVDEGEIANGKPSKDKPMQWSSNHKLALSQWVHKEFDIRHRDAIAEATRVAAMQNQFHPIHEMIQSKPWDGVPRLDTYFIDNVNAEDCMYTREATKVMLLGAIRRIYKPGCSFQYMMILAGEQGDGKSLSLELLGIHREGNYSSGIRDITDEKKVAEKNRFGWIFEHAELRSFKGADNDMRKDFISASHDSVRFAYEEDDVIIPRQTVNFGTTNKDDILSDATGERRYIILPTSTPEEGKHVWDKYMQPSKREEAKAYVQQVWAEGYHRYLQGETDNLQLSKAAQVRQKDLNKQYSRVSELATQIQSWLEEEQVVATGGTASEEYKDLLTEVSIKQIVAECLNKPVEEADKYKFEIEKALKSTGEWIKAKGRKRFGTYGQCAYYKKK
ncbi:VapE domain-containing protein, partial [Bacillus mycoides]|uniref:VapE domain-containing protein n=1 Tax=Bacillus mycoides TaxID=1405 RepID=UPI0024AE0ECB